MNRDFVKLSCLYFQQMQIRNKNNRISLPLELMHRFRFFILITVFISACTSDPKDDGKIDSAGDSVLTRTDTTNRDTIHSDSGSAQDLNYDCSVLCRRIANLKKSAQIQRDLSDLAHCGVDSFDFLYVVPNLFPAWAGENAVQGNDSLTYNDFVDHLNEFRKTDAYYDLHTRVNTLDSLRAVRFDVRKIYTMKPVLGKLGFTEPEWQMFSGFSQTYPVPSKNFTWGDMLEAFEKYSSTAPNN